MTARGLTKVRPEFLLVGTCILEGLFPILANSASHIFPPMFFVGCSALLAAVILGSLLAVRGGFKVYMPLWAVGSSFLVALLIVTVPFTLVFVGSKHTSGINTALMLQMEMLTTFVVYAFLFREKHYFYQYVGALGILLGTCLVLFNGSFAVNRGDLIVLSSTLFFPFGNYFAKKALTVLSPIHVLFFRYFFTVPILLSLSFLTENLSYVPHLLHSHGFLLIGYVLLILIASKTFWYLGLRSLPVSKGIYIISSSPAFSLLFAYVLLQEVPTIYQFMGFLLTTLGVYVLITRRSISEYPSEPV